MNDTPTLLEVPPSPLPPLEQARRDYAAMEDRELELIDSLSFEQLVECREFQEILSMRHKLIRLEGLEAMRRNRAAEVTRLEQLAIART